MRFKIVSILAFIVQLSLSGCYSVAEHTIRLDRTFYNEAIHDTTANQLLLNIVRVKNNESPLFLDVTGIDAASSLQTGVTGGPSMLGSVTGPLGVITGSASYSDAPIVRYAPLSGYPLIEQVSAPITLGSVSRLEDSNWPNAALLTFVFNKLTPAFLDYHRAIDTIVALDAFGAISSDPTSDNSVLKLRFNAEGNLPKTAATSRNGGSRCAPSDREPRAVTRRLWASLQQAVGTDGNVIIFGTSDTKAKHVTVSLRSALGALKLAESNRIRFLPHLEAEHLRSLNTNASCFNGFYYYFPEGDMDADSLWKETFRTVFYENSPSQNSRLKFLELARQRAYILIDTSYDEPSRAYAKIFRDGLWYYIAFDDVVSKINFGLLGQLLTVQAIPAAPPAPTQTAIVR